MTIQNRQGSRRAGSGAGRMASRRGLRAATGRSRAATRGSGRAAAGGARRRAGLEQAAGRGTTSSTKPQYASVPGRETNVLIQGGGHEWRKLRNGPVTFYGGIAPAHPARDPRALLPRQGPDQDARPAHRAAHRALHERGARGALDDGDLLRRAGAHRHRDALRQVHHPADRRARGVLVAHGARRRTCTTSWGRSSSSRW